MFPKPCKKFSVYDPTLGSICRIFSCQGQLRFHRNKCAGQRELGGIWKLEQLNELGLKREQARLVQLSFQVIFDAARKEYIDKGYWMDLDRGRIVHTCNYRPVKALKYVKEEDSCFGLLRIPLLTCYPGTEDQRVRWESAAYEVIPKAVYKEIMEKHMGIFPQP